MAVGWGHRRGGYEAEGPTVKPRMWLAESTKAVVHFAKEKKPTMQLAATARTTQRERIRELELALAAQGEQLRSAEQALTHTQGRLAAATRALGKTEDDSERAERARLATKRIILLAQQSSSSQPELKQSVIDSNTLEIAQLQHDLAALQAQLELSARNEAAAQGALRLWHDEEKGRADLLREMQSEWESRMLALYAPREDQADDETTEDPIPTQGALTVVESPRTGGAELALTESRASTRDPNYARKCLFIDHICHWVASFVRRDWAMVCSTTARAVYRVMYQVFHIWSTTTTMIGLFQSSGRRLHIDNHFLGPEDGPLVAAREAVLALREKAMASTGSDDDPNVRWGNRFFLHMEIAAHTYEEMRIQHRRLFYDLMNRAIDSHKVVATLQKTLEVYDARHASAEDTSEGTAAVDSSAHDVES